MGRVLFQLFTHPADVHHQGVFIAVEVVAPGGLAERVARDNAVAVLIELL